MKLTFSFVESSVAWQLHILVSKWMNETLIPCFIAFPHLFHEPLAGILLEFRLWIQSSPFLSSTRIFCLTNDSPTSKKKNWQPPNGQLNLLSRPRWARVPKVCSWAPNSIGFDLPLREFSSSSRLQVFRCELFGLFSVIESTPIVRFKISTFLLCYITLHPRD